MVFTKIRVVLALVVLALLGAGFWFLKNSHNYATVSPHRGPVVEAVYGLATVVAPKTYQAKTAVAQMVRKLFVQEGSTVTEGQPLLQLEDSGIVRAPFDGVIATTPYRVGELAFPQVALLTLVNLSQLYLEVSLEQQVVLQVRKGQKAKTSFENLRSEELAGTVASVFPRENQFIVRVDLARFPEGVLPGMTADVAIEIGKKDDALLIPTKAIASGRVLLIRNGKKIKVPVQLGVVSGEWAEVKSDTVQMNDLIVIQNK